jgi:hypothetical protein
MKTITLNLVISLIMESVKGETHIKGRVDKAIDDKASALAYNEEAGDDQFHERKLFRTMHTSLSKLKTVIGDYVDTYANQTADNIFTIVDKDSDSITIRLLVSDRFNEAMAEPLAKLCSKYIEDHMLFLWWGTFNVKQAEFYNTLLQIDEKDILSCFTKTAPAIPKTSYTSFIDTQMGNKFHAVKGETFTVTYQVSDDCVDDVEAISGNNAVAQVLSKGDKDFKIYAANIGVTYVRMYSRHDEDICHEIKIIVS